jgi:hypothetical protein
VLDIYSSELQIRSIIREVHILKQLKKMQNMGAFPHTVSLLDMRLF